MTNPRKSADLGAPLTLDLRGYRCPMPVIRMEAALRKLTPGSQLLVFADDPIARVDIPHFCAEGGHVAAQQDDRGDACVFLVTRGEILPQSTPRSD